MSVKNYTSSVSVDRSVSLIEKALVQGGATHIAKIYEDGKLAGLTFQLSLNSHPMIFRLPANVKKVQKLFMNQVKRPRAQTEKRTWEQAERTAWKLLHDWVDVQVSLIKIEQVEFMQVFLPYVYDPIRDQTFYERLKESGFKALPAAERKSTGTT